MDEEKKPEGQPEPEAEQPKGDSPAKPVEGAPAEVVPASESQPTETTPATPAPAKPASPAAASPPLAAEKPAAEKPAADKPVATDKPAAEAKPAADKPAAEAKPAAAKKPPPKKAPAIMEVEPWEGPLVDSLKARFGDDIKEFSTYRGQDFLVADMPAAISILEFLKLEEDFDYLVDLTAVDWPKKEKRFEVIWILYSFAKNVRVRIKADVGEGEKPGTAVGVHKTADWLEREVFDMYGIEFENHPNMTRILLPDEWEGYPLRKDYSIVQQDEAWVRENLQIESGQ